MAPRDNGQRPTVQPRILVAQPRDNLKKFFNDLLGGMGYRVYHSSTQTETLSYLFQNQYEILVYDASLNPDTTKTLENMRKFVSIPILVVSEHKDGNNGAISCLNAGADDHLLAPIHPQEFLARIRKTIRRARQNNSRYMIPAVIEYQNTRIDLDSRKVTREGGGTINLSATEIKILEILLRNPGKLCSKEEIVEEVWGTIERRNFAQYVRTYMTRLRKKLGDSVQKPVFIGTENGLGYRWLTPVPKIQREKTYVQLSSGEAASGTKILSVNSSDGISAAAGVDGGGDGIASNGSTTAGEKVST